MNVLVTGGAGYIGSTIVSALEDSGLQPIILDSLVNGPREFVRSHPFFMADIADTEVVRQIKAEYPSLATVIHCAASTIVPESVAQPDKYFRENVAKSICFLNACKDNGIVNFLFSSSASVYGQSKSLVVDESSEVSPDSPYASSKLLFERLLPDYVRAFKMKALSLRYFNPIGADPSLRTGPYKKDASDILGILTKIYKQRTGTFKVTGTGWPTRDGTGLRDYIHVWDIAKAHVLGVRWLGSLAGHRNEIINLGTGRGTTVREMVEVFSRVCGWDVPTIDTAPRVGDIAGSCASNSKAASLLGWHCEKSVESGIEDALKWADKWCR